jgi:catechol 2,3-dioxygenase-like lactoylglutathione lyase family enzyme
MSEARTGTPIADVGVVMVTVSDQDRAIEFYCDQLGFEKLSDTPYGEGDRWIEVAPSGARTPVALVLPTEGGSPGGPSAFAFHTEDAEAARARLQEEGIDVDDRLLDVRAPAPPMFFFRDPDGNVLLVVQRDG